jgi:release factor glutamine methyltransferase
VPAQVGSKGIEAAWAGGVDGRRVLDRLLPLIPVLAIHGVGRRLLLRLLKTHRHTRTHTHHLLALCQELMSPQGCFYLVVVTENKPEEVMALLASSGFSSKVPHSSSCLHQRRSARSMRSPPHSLRPNSAQQQYVLSRVAFNEHLSILRFWRD